MEEVSTGSADGVLHNAFVLLRVLSEGRQPAGVTELARRSGLPKTTTYRLLQQLAGEGAVARYGRQWVIGRALHELGISTEPLPRLADLARPRLRALALGTGASVFFSVTGSSRLLTIDRSYGSHTTSLIPAQAQEEATEAPESAIWKTLDQGQLATELGQVHQDFACLADAFQLPSGDTAILSMALPRDREIERFKKPLGDIASKISSEVQRMSESF